jgi:hypothetical protein
MEAANEHRVKLMKLSVFEGNDNTALRLTDHIVQSCSVVAAVLGTVTLDGSYATTQNGIVRNIRKNNPNSTYFSSCFFVI